jgi:hypothetical protein
LKKTNVIDRKHQPVMTDECALPFGDDNLHALETCRLRKKR